MVFNPQIGSDEALGHAIHLAVVSQSDKRKMAILYCREASSCKQQRDRALQFASLYGISDRLRGPGLDRPARLHRRGHLGPQRRRRDRHHADRRADHRAGGPLRQTPGLDARWSPAPTRPTPRSCSNPTPKGVLGMAATVPYRSSPKMQPYLDAVARYVPDGALGGYGATAWVQLKLVERLSVGFADRNPTTAGLPRRPLRPEGRDDRRPRAPDHLQPGPARPRQHVRLPDQGRERQADRPPRRELRLRQGLLRRESSVGDHPPRGRRLATPLPADADEFWQESWFLGWYDPASKRGGLPPPRPPAGAAAGRRVELDRPRRRGGRQVPEPAPAAAGRRSLRPDARAAPRPDQDTAAVLRRRARPTRTGTAATSSTSPSPIRSPSRLGGRHREETTTSRWAASPAR